MTVRCRGKGFGGVDVWRAAACQCCLLSVTCKCSSRTNTAAPPALTQNADVLLGRVLLRGVNHDAAGGAGLAQLQLTVEQTQLQGTQSSAPCCCTASSIMQHSRGMPAHWVPAGSAVHMPAFQFSVNFYAGRYMRQHSLLAKAQVDGHALAQHLGLVAALGRRRGLGGLGQLVLRRPRGEHTRSVSSQC